MADSSLVIWVVPFVVGTIAALINVVAGGGSLLTLPLLVELGLTAPVANATNRVAVLTQTASTTATFHRGKRLPVRFAARLLPAVIVGAVAGSWVATIMSEDAFEVALAVIFFAMGLVLLRDILRRQRSESSTEEQPIDGDRSQQPLDTSEAPPAWFYPAFVGIGFYGGFIQAGVGIVMLLVMHVFGGVELLKANAIKSFHVLVYTVFALIVFVAGSEVNWQAGVSLALGGAFGGWAGARFAADVDPKWLKRFLVVAVFVASARFAGLLG